MQKKKKKKMVSHGGHVSILKLGGEVNPTQRDSEEHFSGVGMDARQTKTTAAHWKPVPVSLVST